MEENLEIKNQEIIVDLFIDVLKKSILNSPSEETNSKNIKKYKN
jgi:hypothetical protein